MMPDEPEDVPPARRLGRLLAGLHPLVIVISEELGARGEVFRVAFECGFQVLRGFPAELCALFDELLRPHKIYNLSGAEHYLESRKEDQSHVSILAVCRVDPRSAAGPLPAFLR